MIVLGWEIALLLGSFAVLSIISGYAHLRITKIYALAIAEKVESLNDALGEAIESLLSGDMGSIDPPNPLMGIVAQILSQSLEKPSLTAPTQGEDGKFVKKVIEKIS